MTRVSKYLALRLRHDPGSIGLDLDEGGWASVDELVRRACLDGFELTRSEVDEVVRSNTKQRYELDDARTRIRARQGHSVEVDLGLSPIPPPDLLYHGTVTRFLGLIRVEGLRPTARQHVHLSADVETATVVGERRGRAVVLTVAAGRMSADGHLFYRSTNGVWLTSQVPPSYLVE